ncbi:MAG TPA: nucleotidyltransferase family protein [Micromonosporaceae bacterium]
MLAAGAGRRYGRPKALVEIDGRPLVARAVDTLVAAGCDPVAVVVGAASEKVRALLAGLPAVAVDNPEWGTGMASSLRAGLRALAGTDAVAVVVLLVDMPGITAAAVRRLTGYARSDVLATARYGRRRGHPVLLGRAHWDAVAACATGDAGARGYLARHADRVVGVECGDVADPTDLDVPSGAPAERRR